MKSSATQYLTCIFKIHNPSAHKRAVMDHALEQYTLGYNQLLQYAKDNLELIKAEGQYKDSYTCMSISGLLPRPDCQVHSSAKDSLQRHVAANIASYLELLAEDDNTGYPLGRDPSPQGYPNALEHFALVGSSLEDFEGAVRRLEKRAKGAVMPIYFSRSDGAAQTKSGSVRNRSYSLLITPQKDKLLAVLWLLPGCHELCQPLGADQGNLVKVGTGEIFTSNSSTAILVPLELGRNGWQKGFIDRALNGQIGVKTAYLRREAGEYFLHIAFECPCPDEYEPQAFLGVDRGVFYTMAYGVVDRQGRILLMDHNEDGFRDHNITIGKRIQDMQRRGERPTYRDYQRQEREAILHRLVNQLLDVAQEYQAKIVMEDLNIQIKGKFYKSAWRKFYKITEYKARLAGVPIWKEGIWAAYSSQYCIHCGALNRGRKRDRSPFVCPNPECGEVYHADEGAGVNVARRALYHKDEWEDRGGHRGFHRAIAKAGFLTTE